MKDLLAVKFITGPKPSSIIGPSVEQTQFKHMHSQGEKEEKGSRIIMYEPKYRRT